jgi:hypothetical protein
MAAQDTEATPTGDRLIEKSEQAEIDARTAARAANLFDVRRLIGGLFAIYGVILTVLGIGASDAEIEKSADINVNLWTGLVLLVVAALFLAWAFARPLGQELDEAGGEEDGRTVRGADAPAGPDATAFAGSETTRPGPRSDPDGT